MRLHRNRHTPRLLLAAALLIPCLPIAASADESDERATAAETHTRIVKAETTAIARAAVEAAGGSVLDELSIIASVTAELTAEQEQALASDDRVLRIWQNYGVETQSRIAETKAADCGMNGGDVLDFRNGMFLWDLTNTSRKTFKIEEIRITWPASNGNLKAVRVDNTKIYTHHEAPSAATISGDWAGKTSDRQFHKNEDGTLRFTFAQGVVADASQYTIEVDFNGQCTLVYSPTGGNGNDDSDATAQRTYYPTLIGADELHADEIDGHGVSIAFVDTGMALSRDDETKSLRESTTGADRVLAHYNAIDDREIALFGKSDANGHGTHVASVAVSSRLRGGFFNGVAPGADIVPVRAFNNNGRGTYADVLRGMQWILDNHNRYGIRVVNLSFSAEPQSYYWDDPINQAAMRLWQANVVVVASAGNSGPDAMTIGVPGNNPYVITVGAMSDAVTPLEPGDDYLASFSSAGPTIEGFVKPEVVAPGGHMLGFMDPNDRLPTEHPSFHDGDHYFMMSGTSQAAAVVSGAVALMLEADDTLSPDDVKCRLMSSANPAGQADGTLAYSIFQQGAGQIDVLEAVASTETGCANRGLDVDKDLTGEEHYGGRADMDDMGNYYIRGADADGYLWGDGYLWSDGYMWSDSYTWSDGYLWGDGSLWQDGYLWGDTYLFDDHVIFSDSTVMSINHWVEQE